MKNKIENLGQIYSEFRNEDRVVIIDYKDPDFPREVTFRQFDDACRAVARGLIRKELKPGQHVGILSPNRTEFLEVFFGTMTAGLVPVPINVRLPATAIAKIAEAADLSLIFVDKEFELKSPPGISSISLDDDKELSYRDFLDPGDFVPFAPDEDSIAMLIYTSGSTGRPKGVLLSHRAHTWVARSLVRVANVTRDDRFIVVAPMYHKNALNSVKQVLAAGAQMIILPRWDVDLYLEAASRYRATNLAGVPTMYTLLLQQPEKLARTDLSSVRHVRLGSAPASEALLEAVAAHFPKATVLYNYGITESSPVMFGPHPDGSPRPRRSIGWPLPTTEFKLVGGTPDEGQFLVRTPGMMSGYYKMPDETARRMKDGYFDTGDVLRRDADGWFYFIGRNDDMFVSGGNNVYPAEVEAILERHPDILQAVVVPVPHPTKDKVPNAFVVARTGVTLTEEEIQKHVLENAAPHLHPRRVHFVDSIPLNATNKIDRKMLETRAALVEKTVSSVSN